MAARSFSSTDYYDSRCAAIEPLFAFDASNLTEARQWRIRANAKARDLLGEMPESVPLEAETVESVDLGHYVREKVIFDSDAHSSVPAYVLIPKHLDHPAPALLCLHGHGPGKDVVAGVTDADHRNTQENKLLCIQQQNCDYARQFAQRGYVTMAIDMRCFGERADESDWLQGRDKCSVQFLRGCLLGIYALTLNLHDAIRAVDYLQTRPEIDRALIGCVGISLGGMMAMWTAAMDRRIKAAVVGDYFCRLRDPEVQKIRICGSQILPDLCRYFDACDIAALIPPRALLIQSGLHDQEIAVESAQKAFKRLKKAYRAWEHPEMVHHDVFEGENEFHSPTAFAWFDKWLKSPVIEQEN